MTQLAPPSPPQSLADAPTSSPTQQLRRKAAELLTSALERGHYDPSQVTAWLRESEFPFRWGAEEPYQAIEATLAFVPPRKVRVVRSALGRALAKIIDGKPERQEDVGDLGALLFNIYKLARDLGAKEELHAALLQAFRRGMPDIRDPRAPFGRYLFDAAVANQVDTEFRPFWLGLLRKAAGEADSDDDTEDRPWLRTTWSVQPLDLWDAILAMRWASPRGVVVPAMGAVEEGLPLLTRRIEKDVPSDAAQRRRRFRQALDMLLEAWSDVLNDDNVADAIGRSYLPAWCDSELRLVPKPVNDALQAKLSPPESATDHRRLERSAKAVAIQVYKDPPPPGDVAIFILRSGRNATRFVQGMLAIGMVAWHNQAMLTVRSMVDSFYRDTSLTR